jgi:hypothetical protein
MSIDGPLAIGTKAIIISLLIALFSGWQKLFQDILHSQISSHN